MQITCPSCAAQYAVPDGKLAGRLVKCARCGEQWAPVPAEAVTAEPAREAPPRPFMAVPGTFATPDPPAPPDPHPAVKPNLRPSLNRPPVPIPVVRKEAVPRPTIILAAWVVSAAVLAALVIGAYAARDPIMQAWPPSQRLYAALGLR